VRGKRRGKRERTKEREGERDKETQKEENRGSETERARHVIKDTLIRVFMYTN